MSKGRPPLRLGLLVDGAEVPDWIADVIVEVERRGIGSVVLIVERIAEPASTEATPRIAKWWRNRDFLAFALLQRVDSWRRGLPPAKPAVELGTIVPDAELLKVRPKTTKFSDTIVPEDVEQIRGADLDVLIRIGFRILRGGVLSAARHGVWSFHHGDNRTNRGGPPGVWEVLEDRLVTGVTLQSLTEELDGGVVLARSVGATQRFSITRNIRYMYPRSARMLARSLERLHARNDPVQSSGEAFRAWRSYQHPLYRLPHNREVIKRGAQLAIRYLGHRLRVARKRMSWSIAWHYAPNTGGDAPHEILHRYKEIVQPKDRFWADPFVVRDGERWWMFFEELQYSVGRGVIRVREMGPAGPLSDPVTVLDRPYHLSYPQVFCVDGTWYMLPETSGNRTVELYRATRFPFEWAHDRVLLADTEAVDATLLSHEGRWYLFASIGETGIECTEELSLFVSDAPFGPFARHPASPLVSDITRARMAGQFFHMGGRLYRPAQCAVPLYGAGLVIHEVLELTPERYAERVADVIMPGWAPGFIGLHTINAADGYSVIDLLRRSRS